MEPTKILVPADPVNPDLFRRINYNTFLSAFGLVERVECTPSSIIKGAVGGQQRVSSVASLINGYTRTQGDTGHQPLYIPGGGPSGLLDATYFDPTRGDRLALSLPGEVHTHTVVDVVAIELLTDAYVANTQVYGNLTGAANVGSDGKRLFRAAQTSANGMSVNTFIDGAPAGLSPSVSVTPGVWAMIISCYDEDLDEAATGISVIGSGGQFTWASGAGVNLMPAAPSWALGAGPGPGYADRLKGRWSAGLVFDGFYAFRNPDMLDNIVAWGFGGNSAVGL